MQNLYINTFVTRINASHAVFPFSFDYFRKYILLLAFLNTCPKIVQRETENTTKGYFSFDHARKNIRYTFYANMKNGK